MANQGGRIQKYESGILTYTAVCIVLQLKQIKISTMWNVNFVLK